MTDRPWTDADVETVACTLWAREWSHPGVSPTVEQVLAEHGPLPMRYYANARATLAALAAAGWIRMDPDEPHVIEFRRDGWTIQHPLRCRPDLFGCEVNRVGESLPGPAGPPPDGLGRYECRLTDGRLSIGARRD